MTLNEGLVNFCPFDELNPAPATDDNGLLVTEIEYRIDWFEGLISFHFCIIVFVLYIEHVCTGINKEVATD